MLTEIEIGGAFALQLPIIDVRSPGEFEKGHIPGATNIPLFTNDERAHVGTVYKQQSKEKAIEVGYVYVNPKLQMFIEESRKVAPNGNVIVHCWRGGMRSRSFAQHLSDNGFNDVKVVVGGYKAYRNFVLNHFETPADLKVIGGYTGSGKTYLLKEVAQLGHQMVDLEGLANHKGSAFGSIGENPQPTTEQFENNLSEIWRALDFSKPIYMEDESLSIGHVNIPMQLFSQIRNAQLYFIDIPKEERAKHLVNDYAGYDNQLLESSILRITKRLGGQNVNHALECLAQNNYVEVALTTLHYYDKAYIKGMNKRNADRIVKIPMEKVDAINNAKTIIRFIKEYETNQVNAI